MTYESDLKVSQVKKKGCEYFCVCVCGGLKTDSPHGSGEASDVLYDYNHLVDFMLNNFRKIVNSFNGDIIVFLKVKNEELSPFCHE